MCYGTRSHPRCLCHRRNSSRYWYVPLFSAGTARSTTHHGSCLKDAFSDIACLTASLSATVVAVSSYLVSTHVMEKILTTNPHSRLFATIAPTLSKILPRVPPTPPEITVPARMMIRLIRGLGYAQRAQLPFFAHWLFTNYRPPFSDHRSGSDWKKKFPIGI